MTREPLLRLPPLEFDYFSSDPDHRARSLRLEYKRQQAKRWMWLNNIRERRHAYLQRVR